MRRAESEDDDLSNYDIWIIECSGRRCYANGGILGLGPNPDVGEWPSEGYDGIFTPEYMGYSREPFTPAERREIADEMIKRWQQWAGH